MRPPPLKAWRVCACGKNVWFWVDHPSWVLGASHQLGAGGLAGTGCPVNGLVLGLGTFCFHFARAKHLQRQLSPGGERLSTAPGGAETAAAAGISYPDGAAV